MPTPDTRAEATSPFLKELFDRDSLSPVRVRFEAQRAIYATGDEDDALYLIESGQVKLIMSSASGRECLLAIYTAGDVFGESCLQGTGKRNETAETMKAAVVRRVSRREFLAEVYRSGAYESLIRHLAARLAERQAAIFDLVTMSAERRLAKVLLAFAEKLGVADGPYLRMQEHISHEDLSQMVGTTRPRITKFMQGFRKAGLIQGKRILTVNRDKMRAFLELE